MSNLLKYFFKKSLSQLYHGYNPVTTSTQLKVVKFINFFNKIITTLKCYNCIIFIKCSLKILPQFLHDFNHVKFIIIIFKLLQLCHSRDCGPHLLPLISAPRASSSALTTGTPTSATNPDLHLLHGDTHTHK